MITKNFQPVCEAEKNNFALFIGHCQAINCMIASVNVTYILSPQLVSNLNSAIIIELVIYGLHLFSTWRSEQSPQDRLFESLSNSSIKSYNAYS